MSPPATVTLYYANRYFHADDKIVIHKCELTKRKDGKMRSRAMLPFFLNAQILDSYMLAQMSKTPEEALDKMRARLDKELIAAERHVSNTQALIEMAKEATIENSRTINY